VDYLWCGLSAAVPTTRHRVAPLGSLFLAERRVALAVDEVAGTERIDPNELGRLPPLLAGAAEMVRAIRRGPPGARTRVPAST